MQSGTTVVSSLQSFLKKKLLEANFDRKINKMSNVLLEKLQNLIDKAFGSAEINHRSISDDENQNKCPHEIGY